jgi:hypothetical protein
MGQRETSGKHGKPLSKEGDVSGDRRHRVVDFCVGYVTMDWEHVGERHRLRMYLSGYHPREQI